MGEAEALARRAWARLGSRQENQAFVFLLVSPNGMANVPQALTILQWRVRLWQDDSPFTPPFIIPLVLFNASLVQVITGSVRVRHSNNHQIRNNTNGFESWPLLRTAIRDVLRHQPNPDWG